MQPLVSLKMSVSSATNGLSYEIYTVGVSGVLTININSGHQRV